MNMFNIKQICTMNLYYYIFKYIPFYLGLKNSGIKKP